MTSRLFPLIANRLAELTNIPIDATIVCGGTNMGVATLSASVFLLPDLVAVLRAWRRMLQPGRAVAFSCLGPNAFQPLVGLYEARIRICGVQPAAPMRHASWQSLADPEQCHDLLREAGFEAIEVRAEQLGFYLQSPGEWWDIVSNSGFQASASQLPQDQLATFKAEHLAEVSALAPSNGNGIWLDVPTIFAVGRVVNVQAQG